MPPRPPARDRAQRHTPPPPAHDSHRAARPDPWRASAPRTAGRRPRGRRSAPNASTRSRLTARAPREGLRAAKGCARGARAAPRARGGAARRTRARGRRRDEPRTRAPQRKPGGAQSSGAEHAFWAGAAALGLRRRARADGWARLCCLWRRLWTLWRRRAASTRDVLQALRGAARSGRAGAHNAAAPSAAPSACSAGRHAPAAALRRVSGETARAREDNRLTAVAVLATRRNGFAQRGALLALRAFPSTQPRRPAASLSCDAYLHVWRCAAAAVGRACIIPVHERAPRRCVAPPVEGVFSARWREAPAALGPVCGAIRCCSCLDTARFAAPPPRSISLAGSNACRRATAPGPAAASAVLQAQQTRRGSGPAAGPAAGWRLTIHAASRRSPGLVERRVSVAAAVWPGSRRAITMRGLASPARHTHLGAVHSPRLAALTKAPRWQCA